MDQWLWRCSPSLLPQGAGFSQGLGLSPGALTSDVGCSATAATSETSLKGRTRNPYPQVRCTHPNHLLRRWLEPWGFTIKQPSPPAPGKGFFMDIPPPSIESFQEPPELRAAARRQLSCCLLPGCFDPSSKPLSPQQSVDPRRIFGPLDRRLRCFWMKKFRPRKPKSRAFACLKSAFDQSNEVQLTGFAALSQPNSFVRQSVSLNVQGKGVSNVPRIEPTL